MSDMQRQRHEGQGSDLPSAIKLENILDCQAKILAAVGRGWRSMHYRNAMLVNSPFGERHLASQRWFAIAFFANSGSVFERQFIGVDRFIESPPSFRLFP
jgi:hypothetical protein